MAALIGLSGLASAEIIVTTLEGPPSRGLSLQVSGERLTFQSPAGKVTELGLADVVEVLSSPAPAAPPQNTRIFEVELTCGSRLRGVLTAAPADFVRLRGPIVGTHQFDIEMVRAVRRVAGKPIAAASQLVRVPEKDAAYRVSGGRVEGVITEFSATGFTIDRGEDFGERKIPYRELAAIFVDNEALAPAKGLHARLSLATGGIVVLARGFAIEGGVVRGVTPSGLTLRVPVGQIAAVHFAGGRFLYVSDLKAEAVERKPFFPLPEGTSREAMLDFVCPVRIDRSPDGRPIHLRQRRYFKGMGVRPYTALTYDLTKLGGAIRRFESICGIDDEVLGPGYGRGGGSGSVVFEVYVDGKRVAQTGIVRGGGEPVRIRANVEDGKKLRLVVRLVPADKLAAGVTDTPALDNAVWARPLLVR